MCIIFNAWRSRFSAKNSSKLKKFLHSEVNILIQHILSSSCVARRPNEGPSLPQNILPDFSICCGEISSSHLNFGLSTLLFYVHRFGSVVESLLCKVGIYNKDFSLELGGMVERTLGLYFLYQIPPQCVWCEGICIVDSDSSVGWGCLAWRPPWYFSERVG